MNVSALLKLQGMYEGFSKRHPKVVAFTQKHLMGDFEENTVLEVSIKRPGLDPVSCNMRVTAEDLEMIEELKKLR